MPVRGFTTNVDISGDLGYVIHAGPLLLWVTSKGNVIVNYLFGGDYVFNNGRGFFFLFFGEATDEIGKVSIKGMALYGYSEPLL